MNAQRLQRIPHALRRFKTALLLTALLLLGARNATAMVINLTFDPDATFTAAGLSAADILQMKAAAAYTASLLTAHFSDPINVNIKITAVAGTSTLGGSSTSLSIVSYATMRTKMLAEIITADDATALSTSPIGSVPAADPQPGGHWVVSRAQAKALGITPDNAVTIDGTFTFGGGHSYTYNPNNRTVAGRIDWIGVALHEYTEIMGRIFLMGENLDGSPDYMLLDLFHFSAPGTHSFTTGAGRYFSIDNGTNNLKAFNNFDSNGGDAQDYASGANDAFNAFSSSGVENPLTEVGLRNQDVIGYNRLLLPVALDATNLTWTVGGSLPWLPQSTNTHDGVDSARSGPVTNSQSSFVQASVTGPTTLSWWWKVSSETNFDFLTVSMDGNNSNAISGEVGYVLATMAVPAGAHAIRWTYSKDGTISNGVDAAWLDQVTTAGANVAPVLAAIEAGALAYTENQAATAITATLTAADVDNANLASGSVSITANFASGQDVLAMSPNPQNGITATYNAGTGVLSLSGSATVANYQTALRTVTYVNTSENPSTATRTVSFLVNDGTANSNPQARNITVAGVNDAPVLASIEAGALAYTENQAATAITATLTAADVDNANLASGSVSITANFASGQDVLAMSPNPQNGITATYNAGTGVLSLSGSATVANYQTALRTVTYVNTSENPSTATRTVSFLVNDGTANSNPQARNITVAGVNDAPVLASIEAGALAYTENQAATAITATLTAADVDNANLASGSVSITANFASGQDVLSMSPNPQNGITATYNAGTGVLSLSGSATVANYQAALRSVRYNNSSESPSTLTRTVSFVVSDGALNSSAQARNITVATVNDAPTLASIEAGALAYTENQVATAITATITAADLDNANLASGTISITANFASGQDVLAMSPNPQNGITATYNAGTGVLSLSGSASVANYQAALRSVSYFNSSENPSTATRTVSFVVNDGAANSGSQTRNITVAGVNDAPVLANIEAGVLSYAVHQVATALTTTLTVSDVDNANLVSGSVSLTAGFASGQDVLAMAPNPQNGITASYNAGTGVLSLSGSSSVANYQAALRSVSYTNSSSSPSTVTRTVRWLVNDGAVNSNPQSRNIDVIGSGPVVAVVGAEIAAWNQDVRQKLLGLGVFGAVDIFQADTGTPSLAQLQNYVAVLVFSDQPFNNATVLGNNLADYVDGGGRVVVGTFGLDGGGGLGLDGRLVSGGYLPYVPGGQDSGVELALVGDNPGHPILAGVGSFSGGESSYHNVVSLAAGGSLVAHWDNGVPLVTTKLSGPGRVVGLNMFPVSETARDDFWRTNTAGARLMGNALLWTNVVPVPPVSPVDTNVPSILLFVDDTSVPSAYQGALAYAGLPYQLFTSESLFNSTVSTSAPSSTLVVMDSIATVHSFGPVVSFVANGGRAIVYYWNLDGDAGLAAAFNATVVQDILTPVAVNDWGGSFFFSHVGSPLALFERGYSDDGDKLQPTAGGVAVAGHTASPADGQACVVIGNGGRTIVNSMALQDATNATVQAAQFALNEIYYLLAPGHGGGRVAVIGAEETPSWNEDVRQKLLGTGAFEAVDIFQADAVTPSLAQLQAYSAVLVYSDSPFNSSNALGNVLADYADAGGGVVLATFALSDSTYNIAGRLLTDGYLPFVAGTIASGAEITLVPDQASHPILAGVGSLVGGSSSYHNVVTVAPNADLIAHWSNGRPLVMTKVTGMGRVVGLNFFPPSETVRGDFWRTNTAGGLLMANALRWSALPDCTLKTNYVAVTTFTDAVLADITVSVAFDGTNFWSASGGDIGGDRLARYSAAGVFQAAFTPGIDFRSLFTDAGGRLYARGVNSQEILRQTTPGTFVTHAILSGGSLNGQAAVILNGNANEYVALNVGTVSRWSTNGTFLGDVTLAGFGTVAGEDGDLQNVRLAAVGNSWLTYNGNQVLSVWNQNGSRIGTAVLQDAGTSFDSGVSISYCAGKAFVLDTSGGLWRGYDICTSPELPYLSRPVRLAGGQFRMDLHATPARSYTIERTANFTSWTPFLTNTPLAPNTVITDTGAAGNFLFYRARTQ